MKYSNNVNNRRLNNKNTIKKTRFGKLVYIPKKLLTSRYKKKCRDKVPLKPVFNIPRKKKKGRYLLLPPFEKSVLTSKKKKFTKKCY